MRIRKIRGHNRRHKDIENWKISNLDLNLDILQEYERDYTEIIIHPWCDLSTTNSHFPEPKGKTKQLMLDGLLEIYDSWKQQLEKMGKPYYLKIWIFEPRFSKSQVVCAIGDNIEFYKTRFSKPENEKNFNSELYGNLKEKLENFDWYQRLDEAHYTNDEIGEPEMYTNREAFESHKTWFDKILKKPHKVTKLENPIGKTKEVYSFLVGNIWIGEK